MEEAVLSKVIFLWARKTSGVCVSFKKTSIRYSISTQVLSQVILLLTAFIFLTPLLFSNLEIFSTLFSILCTVRSSVLSIRMGYIPCLEPFRLSSPSSLIRKGKPQTMFNRLTYLKRFWDKDDCGTCEDSSATFFCAKYVIGYWISPEFHG